MHSGDERSEINLYEITANGKTFEMGGTSIGSDGRNGFVIYKDGDIVAMFSSFDHIVNEHYNYADEELK